MTPRKVVELNGGTIILHEIFNFSRGRFLIRENDNIDLYPPPGGHWWVTGHNAIVHPIEMSKFCGNTFIVR